MSGSVKAVSECQAWTGTWTVQTPHHPRAQSTFAKHIPTPKNPTCRKQHGLSTFPSTPDTQTLPRAQLLWSYWGFY